MVPPRHLASRNNTTSPNPSTEGKSTTSPTPSPARTKASSRGSHSLCTNKVTAFAVVSILGVLLAAAISTQPTTTTTTTTTSQSASDRVAKVASSYYYNPTRILSPLKALVTGLFWTGGSRPLSTTSSSSSSSVIGSTTSTAAGNMSTTAKRTPVYFVSHGVSGGPFQPFSLVREHHPSTTISLLRVGSSTCYDSLFESRDFRLV